MHSFGDYYHHQVALLLRILPIVADQKCFALKGGTAINFFVRDMPRLSVDIDLTYVPIESRDISLQKIEDSLLAIKQAILIEMPNLTIQEKRTKYDSRLNKLFITEDGIQIKIEPNEILRGTLFPVEYCDLSNTVEEAFGLAVSEYPVLSFAEVYAGKICAALDRQHPRDLFDIQLLFEDEGLTDNIRKAFVVYLACSPRPMVELLSPNRLDMQTVYEDEFAEMTQIPFSYGDYMETREQLITTIQHSLTTDERQFLLSIKTGNPVWECLDFESLHLFPALKWKLLNIGKMSRDKHYQAVERLKMVLEI